MPSASKQVALGAPSTGFVSGVATLLYRAGRTMGKDWERKLPPPAIIHTLLWMIQDIGEDGLSVQDHDIAVLVVDSPLKCRRVELGIPGRDVSFDALGCCGTLGDEHGRAVGCWRWNMLVR